MRAGDIWGPQVPAAWGRGGNAEFNQTQKSSAPVADGEYVCPALGGGGFPAGGCVTVLYGSRGVSLSVTSQGVLLATDRSAEFFSQYLEGLIGAGSGPGDQTCPVPGLLSPSPIAEIEA